ncbi:MAG: 50S ribosomal protein L4 [Candidatus Yanofskybacteria bacterium RIFCSPHIGHO2_01_FULL_44_17]|uniref:Large ribosomal subunit protein uL4 n=1 Tax=Candidatus Yanofskybacteria bacterium RIFCSPHIGHO2_01_FULL_44_17 TaxID=1802668 RepID=A0A1F8ETP4_9BACT|nr:MAG: 50S ribosomal protein L4 [Candidatus Yanofskybacteria bacterium RIFCSPHIGHO2_01_FULL_44_17]
MKTELYNQSGELMGNVELPDKIFGVAMNEDLVRQVLEAQSANSRRVIAHTKDRSEVRGGGKKPWKQKGTGRARHASIRSPIWKGGGVAFGPTKERNFAKKINKKMKRSALFMALSSKLKDGQMMLLDGLNFETPKTKVGVAIIKNLSSKMEGYRTSKKKSDSILLVVPSREKTISRTVNNLSYVETLPADSLNIKDVLTKKYMFLLQGAVSVIEKTFKL